MTVRSESALALVEAVVDALVHRLHCLQDEAGRIPEAFARALSELESVGVPIELEAEGRTVSARRWLEEQGVQLPVPDPKCTTALSPRPLPYVRRANNQVSAETEALIRDLLAQGRTKTAIARALRVNRRVVIRVAREMAQSAQPTAQRLPNDLGKS